MSAQPQTAFLPIAAMMFVAGIGILLQESREAHEETGCAETALQRVLFVERLLQRVQLIALGEPFHGADLAPVGLHCVEEA